MKNKNVYFVFTALALLVGGGFYFLLTDIRGLKNNINSLELNLRLLADKPSSQNQPPEKASETASSTEPETIVSETKISMPTSIIFETDSSPLLLPQVKIIVAVENVYKDEGGIIGINIKAFTSNASAYTALEPRDLFELINLSGENQKPFQTTGQFNSIPPKSSASGSMIFKTDPASDSVIIQIGSGETIKYYEFNFKKKNYKETIIG